MQIHVIRKEPSSPAKLELREYIICNYPVRPHVAAATCPRALHCTSVFLTFFRIGTKSGKKNFTSFIFAGTQERTRKHRALKSRVFTLPVKELEAIFER